MVPSIDDATADQFADGPFALQLPPASEDVMICPGFTVATIRLPSADTATPLQFRVPAAGIAAKLTPRLVERYSEPFCAIDAAVIPSDEQDNPAQAAEPLAEAVQFVPKSVET